MMIRKNYEEEKLMKNKESDVQGEFVTFLFPFLLSFNF